MEDFEGGAAGWTLPTAADSLWELGIPTTTDFNANLTTTTCTNNSFVTDLDANYSNSANAALYSPYFNFSSFTSTPVLRFYINRRLESCCDET